MIIDSCFGKLCVVWCHMRKKYFAYHTHTTLVYFCNSQRSKVEHSLSHICIWWMQSNARVIDTCTHTASFTFVRSYPSSEKSLWLMRSTRAHFAIIYYTRAITLFYTYNLFLFFFIIRIYSKCIVVVVTAIIANNIYFKI